MMKPWQTYLLSFVILAQGCGNPDAEGSKKENRSENAKPDSMATQTHVNPPAHDSSVNTETVLDSVPAPGTFDLGDDSLMMMVDTNSSDTYKWENDSLLQMAYIHYLEPTKIAFVLRSFDKIRQKTRVARGTATLPYALGSNPDTYDDELDRNEPYPVYEFSSQRDKLYIDIGVEPSRGKRMSANISKSLKILEDADCPIGSMGTLRRIKLSAIAQTAPALPKPPSH